MVDLNSETVELCAIKAYDSPHFIISEFKDDFKHFNYLKRLFRRYHKEKVLREQLIINHLVAIYNVFNTTEATRLLFYSVNKHDYSSLKTFLVFMGLMPDKIDSIRGETIYSYDISLDPIIIRFLKELRYNAS
jgi:hypothetical protein